MHHSQRSSLPSSATAVKADADVIQAALKLHHDYLEVLEQTHHSLGHHNRQRSFGERREFLEHVIPFPAPALNALGDADVEGLRVTPLPGVTPQKRIPLPVRKRPEPQRPDFFDVVYGRSDAETPPSQRPRRWPLGRRTHRPDPEDDA